LDGQPSIVSVIVTDDPAMGPDFTEQRFRWLVRLARTNYRFEPFGTACVEPHILWRHDIDYSLEQASRIATIEADEGVAATYFFLVTCRYYSLLEREARRQGRDIARRGHHIGLHFDPLAHADDRRPMAEIVAWERRLLEDLLGAPVETVSFHNPAQAGVLDLTQPEIAGLLNVYGGRVKTDYVYASDSFGLWRYKPIHEVLLEAEHPRLHLLTHPVWWTVEPADPRSKIARCIGERSQFLQETYDQLLRDSGMWPALAALERKRP